MNAQDAYISQIRSMTNEINAMFDDVPEEARIDKLRAIFNSCGVFDKAETLVERSQERAEAIVEDIEDEKVQALLRFFLETVLARDDGPTPAEHLDPDSGDPPPSPAAQPVFVPLTIGSL